MEKVQLVVSRHRKLLDYLVEANVVEPGTKQITHATPKDVAGKHVAGMLPLNLASLCKSLTVVGLNTPLKLRGTELSLEDIRCYASSPKRYEVREIDETMEEEKP